MAIHDFEKDRPVSPLFSRVCGPVSDRACFDLTFQIDHFADLFTERRHAIPPYNTKSVSVSIELGRLQEIDDACARLRLRRSELFARLWDLYGQKLIRTLSPEPGRKEETTDA